MTNYDLYAIRYGFHDRPARENFVGGDSHDVPMPLDYFVWAIVGGGRAIVVDTGFDPAVGRRRGRTVTRPVGDGLKAVGIDAATVESVIITHMHYDHAANHDLFPRARYHLQEKEMQYCTGACMCHTWMQAPFEVDDVTAMVRRTFEGRVAFHDGDDEIAPGVTVHLVGGHSMGLQVVRVTTRRGWVVLASGATHFYANIDQGRPFPVLYNAGDVLRGYDTLRRLAESPRHIIPGHDPLVLTRFPAAHSNLEGVARLDLDPIV
jgi:glyoxylase-like metal-dependent hydrolase (beta-lactamase superfamily II)